MAKKPLTKAKKPITIPKLKKKAQTVFNKWIRERDRQPNGKWICISCGEEFDSVHAGHYFPVPGWQHMRFDELNVNSQCGGCNLYRNGNLQLYRRNLIKKIGEEKVLALEDKAIREQKAWKEWTRPHEALWTRPQLEEIIEKYKL